jgi:predicted TIM-barrel fold metal-dependent hydrolase
MIDAYCHLQMSAERPITDLKRRMDAAGVDHALVVETWSGDNRAHLQHLIASTSTEFRVALCFRPEEARSGAEFLSAERVRALRVRTGDLHRLGSIAMTLEDTGKWLLPHAESGIGALTEEVVRMAALHPGLHVYLPHMGWPRRESTDDHDWRESISRLSEIPNLVIGISAMGHFSREPFPHPDVAPFAAHLLATFGSKSLVVASDYPLLEQDRYERYIQLACDWIGDGNRHRHDFEASLFGEQFFGGKG